MEHPVLLWWTLLCAASALNVGLWLAAWRRLRRAETTAPQDEHALRRRLMPA